MKLAIIRQQYRPDGGAERFISRALEGLSHSKDLNVTVIAREWQGTTLPNNINLIECNPAYKGRIAREQSFADQAQQLWQNGGFDLIQSHERIPGCSIYRAGDGVHKVWLQQRKRILSSLRAWWQSRSKYHKYVLAAEKAMFEHPSLRAVICNSEMVKVEICDHFQIEPAKIHVIYNGIDCEVFSPCTDVEKSSLRKKLGLQEKPTFLYVGSGFERKGVVAAIIALAKLQADAQLVVVGKEKKLKAYQKLAKQQGVLNQVHFAGVQTNTQDYYRSADALVHPALYDPFPNVILEAMACGLPIITSTKCGGAEFIRNGMEGYVTDALDSEAISDAMRKLLDPAHSQTLGQHAREKVMPYSIEYCTQQLSQLYQSLSETESQP